MTAERCARNDGAQSLSCLEALIGLCSLAGPVWGRVGRSAMPPLAPSIGLRPDVSTARPSDGVGAGCPLRRGDCDNGSASLSTRWRAREARTPAEQPALLWHERPRFTWLCAHNRYREYGAHYGDFQANDQQKGSRGPTKKASRCTLRRSTYVSGRSERPHRCGLGQ